MGALQCGDGQIALQALRETVDLLLLALLQFNARKHRSAREREAGQSARPIQHRAQRLSAPDRIRAGKADFARDRDLLLLAPLGHFLDVQVVERLQHYVGGRVTTNHGRQIHFDQFGFTAAGTHAISGELRLSTVGGILQVAART